MLTGQKDLTDVRKDQQELDLMVKRKERAIQMSWDRINAEIRYGNMPNNIDPYTQAEYAWYKQQFGVYSTWNEFT